MSWSIEQGQLKGFPDGASGKGFLPSVLLFCRGKQVDKTSWRLRRGVQWGEKSDHQEEVPKEASKYGVLRRRTGESQSRSRGLWTRLVLDHGSTWGHMGVLPSLLQKTGGGFVSLF
jgi:hypothetical protein